MSQSLASAKKRRAPNEPLRNTPQQKQSDSSSSQSSNMQNGGLTLPQVIQLVDRRLIVLEKFMNETQPMTKNKMETIEESNDESEPVISSQLKEFVEEFDKRYELLAEEIVNLKNIVLSLQSYTMEVNKVLYDERKPPQNPTE